MISRVVPILGYILATLAVFAGTFLLIAYGNGYSYDFKKNRLVHRGLLILQSTPSGATVTLGNKKLSQKTPYRNTFEAGTYDLELSRDGYRGWHKRVEIIPSQVSLAQYVILLQNQLKVTESGSFPEVSQFLASRDRRRIAFVVPKGAGAGIWSMDSNSRQQTRIYSAALGPDGSPSEDVQIVAWSEDHSHLMVNRKVGDTTSVLVLGDSPTETPVDVGQTFGLAVDNLKFDPSDWRLLYWNSPDGLKRLDLGDKTASAVLAQSVTGYTFAGNRIIFASGDKNVASLFLMERNGTKKKIVDKLAPSSAYEIAYASYIGVPKIVVVAEDSRKMTLYSGIDGKAKAVNLPATGVHADFNGDGRFVLQSDEGHISTYDLEKKTTYSLPDTAQTSGLSWFDNYHILYNHGGKSILSEFDGNYAQAIANATGLQAFGAADTKSVLYASPSKNGTASIKSVRIRQ